MIRFYFRFSPYFIQNFKKIAFIALVVFIGVSFFQFFDLPKKAAIRSSSIIDEQDLSLSNTKRWLELLGVNKDSYKAILSQNLPFITAQAKSKNEARRSSIAYTFFSIDPTNPLSFFGKGVRQVEAREVMSPTLIESNPLFEDEGIVEILDIPFDQEQEQFVDDLATDPKVLRGAEIIIINTHNAETYKATDGVSKEEGKNSGVSKVAAHLEKMLKDQYGLTVARSDKIHDFPKFEESYTNSGETLKKLLADNPHARVVIDIHRDAGHAKPLVTTINDKKTAQIRLIVGSDARLAHGGWQQNREFARQVTEKMDELYPGLSLGYRVQSGRYNQHLHPRAILLEVGNDLNSLAEATQAIELFAEVLAELLGAREKV
ncbi:MAG: stage II sporulation protein P [Bacillota bacterium]